MQAAPPKSEDRNQEATCYVGNIDERATESLLQELFIQAGPVVNVFLPKDRIANVHQGYGFVEFLQEQDADYAIKVLNNVKIYGKPIRLNKAQMDKEANEPDVGATLFVGNLDPMVDEKLLYDTFSAFGPLLKTPAISREAATSESKGYGFVYYDNFESADLAIESMNGQYLMNRCVTVNFAMKKDGTGRHGDAIGNFLTNVLERQLAASAKKHGIKQIRQKTFVDLAHASGMKFAPLPAMMPDLAKTAAAT